MKMSIVVDNDWKPLAKCIKILGWRAISTLKNNVCNGVNYPFMCKDPSNRWLGNDGEFTKWLTSQNKSNRR